MPEFVEFITQDLATGARWPVRTQPLWCRGEWAVVATVEGVGISEREWILLHWPTGMTCGDGHITATFIGRVAIAAASTLHELGATVVNGKLVPGSALFAATEAAALRAMELDEGVR